MMIELDEKRFIRLMKEQAAIGATNNDSELHRLAPSPELKEVYDWYCDRLREEDLAVRIDEIGNIFGLRAGTDPDADPVLVGSHLDSHPYGGIYDGALGVVAGLELVKSLNEQAIETTRPVELVCWFNEEAGRFPPGQMGSKVWVGEVDLDDAYRTVDDEGRTLQEELDRIGYLGDTPATPATTYNSYLELHIEQGPRLREWGGDIGVVQGINGTSRGTVTYQGVTDHSGGTPMTQRRDALVAAADVILQVRRIPGTIDRRMVGTTGSLTVRPNNFNAIPGEVEFTWEFRGPDNELIDRAVQRVTTEIEHSAYREGINCSWEEMDRVQSVDMSDRCIEAIERAADACGYTAVDIFSGGGHDAQTVNKVCETGMVFAVNESGKSHTREEYTSWEHCYTGANTLANAVLQLAE